MPMETARTTFAVPFVDTLFAEQLARGIGYFFTASELEVVAPIEPRVPELTCRERGPRLLELDCLGSRYTLTKHDADFTDAEKKLLKAIGRVLAVRYQVVFDTDLSAQSAHLFRGVPEDRYVSAFLAPSFYTDVTVVAQAADRIADAIEVLRVTSLSTYENRRIATGVLLFGPHADACHAPPPLPVGALPYSIGLTSIRSFHRLCDGLQTLALVDRNGLLVELVDVQEWAQPYAGWPLPVPGAARYQVHNSATLCGGHVCLVLTPAGEIKIFADGAQTFSFLGGRWRLTDAFEKYTLWQQAVGNDKLAERLFTVASNLAEDRRGGLFVVLDEVQSAGQLVSPNDLLLDPGGPVQPSRSHSKDQLHYLLRSQRVNDLTPTVLESVARIDGAIVLDRESHLIAFGAILRNPGAARESGATEGGRTTAALAASQFGNTLKVSEDGVISFYRQGRCVWDI